MSGAFVVRFAASAQADLFRLFDFELARATTVEDLDRAQAAVEAVRAAAQGQLALTPYSFRKAGRNPLRRELIIPFGATGYVALYQIEPPSRVVVLAVRHQRENDYH